MNQISYGEVYSRFTDSKYWKSLKRRDKKYKFIVISEAEFFEVPGWEIEVCSSCYSTVFFMNKVGQTQVVRTIVVDENGIERYLNSLPTKEVLSGYLTV